MSTKILFVCVVMASSFLISTLSLDMKVERKTSGFDSLVFKSKDRNICNSYNSEFVSESEDYITCLCNEPIFYSLNSYDVPQCHKYNAKNIGCNCVTSCISEITERDTIMSWRVLSDAFSCSDAQGTYEILVWSGKIWEKTTRKDFQLVFKSVYDARLQRVNQTSFEFKWRHNDRGTAMLYYHGNIFKVSVYCGSKSFGCHIGKAAGTRSYNILREHSETTTTTTKTTSTTKRTQKRNEQQPKKELSKNEDGSSHNVLYILLGVAMVLVIVVICVIIIVVFKRKRKESNAQVTFQHQQPPSYSPAEFVVENPFVVADLHKPSLPYMPPQRAPIPRPRTNNTGEEIMR